MFKLLLLALVFGLAAAATKNTCETTREQILHNFLIAEKGRSFAYKLSNKGKEWGFEGKLRHVRWLPIFYDENAKFSQFFLLEGNFTATEANTACQKLDGGYLASLHSLKRLEFANKALVAGNYWFGLNRWANCPVFTWSNGELLGEKNLFWNGDKEPRATSTAFDCVRAVTPTDMTCNATFCSAKSFASWKTEECDNTNTRFSALCETTYPRAMYGYIPGKFDFKSAAAACKSNFALASNAGLAMPKNWASLNNLIWSANVHFQKWNCWVGMERKFENAIWKTKWFDNTWANRNSYLPRLYGSNYSSWTDTQTCGSLYDGYYAKSLGFENKGYFDYNSCDKQLDCAICEWYWPL